MPIAVPTMPPSASGVSITRSSPNSSQQPRGGAEDAADLADVLAQHDHAGVAPHLEPQRVVDRLDHVHLRHRRASSSGSARRRRRARARPRSAASLARRLRVVLLRCGATRLARALAGARPRPAAWLRPRAAGAAPRDLRRAAPRAGPRLLPRVVQQAATEWQPQDAQRIESLPLPSSTPRPAVRARVVGGGVALRPGR